MESLGWRSWVKVVATIDLVLLGSSTLILVPVIPSLVSWDPVVIIALLIFIVMVAIHIWATYKLLTSSYIKTTPDQSLQKARVWKNVTIMFLTIGIFGGLLRLIKDGWHNEVTLWSLVIAVVYRGACLYTVNKFICEVKGLVTTTNDAV